MINIFNTRNSGNLNYIITHTPNLIANIKGNKNFPNINGLVEFYKLNVGVLVKVEIENLPHNNYGDFFAMHIHNGESCKENENGEYENTPHFNFQNRTHPNHEGDFPVLLSNNGYAFMVFYTDRFNINDILNKTIFIHENADDYRTDPSGNSGNKIACGKITRKL